MPRSFPFALLRVKMTSHTRPANLRDITLDICILAVRANVDQRETRSLAFRLDSHDVLVLPGPDFEFDVIAPAAAASQFMRAALGVVGHVRVKVEMVLRCDTREHCRTSSVDPCKRRPTAPVLRQTHTAGR